VPRHMLVIGVPRVMDGRCWRCILVHQACSLHFGLDLFMELTRH
jgi:hypothetical protein